MRVHSILYSFLLLTASGLLFVGCKPAETSAPQPQTLSQLLATGNNLTLLRAAITRAGLDTQLGQAGAITLFAPSDAAFRAAGYADVNAINAIPADTLKRLLQYHVLSTKLLSSSMTVGVNIPQATLAGPPVYITRTITTSTTATTSTATTGGGTVSINGARIAQANTEATNGVIHVIDKVLMPPSGDLIQTLTRLSQQGPNSFTLLTAAIARVNSATITSGTAVSGTAVSGTAVSGTAVSGTVVSGTLLTGAGPYTLFAPTDSAFAAAGYANVAAINAIPMATLVRILTNHVVNGLQFSTNLQTNVSLTSQQGGMLTPTLTNNLFSTIGAGSQSATVRRTDVLATNGVIHTINQVLSP